MHIPASDILKGHKLDIFWIALFWENKCFGHVWSCLILGMYNTYIIPLLHSIYQWEKAICSLFFSEQNLECCETMIAVLNTAFRF